jgi:hypothetical protein
MEFPGLSQIIPLVVKSIDVRYLSRAVKAVNKFYRINHEDPKFDSALEAAGFHVNELGMNLFHSAILEYEKRAANLELVRVSIDDVEGEVIVGVRETYSRKGKEDVTIEYQTSPDDCTCRRFLKKGICLHMIEVRIESGMPIFATSMFLRGRLLKDLTAYDHCEVNLDREINATSDEPPDADVYSTDIGKVVKKPASDKDKWCVANEITKEITENVSRYHGERFDESLNFLSLVEKLTRTNGFSSEVMKYLEAPQKFKIVPVEEVALISPSQLVLLNSQIEFYNNLVSAPGIGPVDIQGESSSPSFSASNAPQTPMTPDRRAWPRSPFPTFSSPTHMSYHPPTPSTPIQRPSTQSSTSVSSPQARALRFSNPPQSPLVSGTPSNHFKSPATSLFSTPGLIRRIRPRPPFQATRPKIPVRMSPDLIKSFIKLSAANSSIGIETGAILGGFLSNNKSFYTVDSLFVPDQIGYAASYSDTNSEACAVLMVQRNRQQLGTIHTHPGHLESFMSSIDLHMHSRIQKDCASSIAFVHSPKYNTTPAYSLTDFGLGGTIWDLIPAVMYSHLLIFRSYA